MKERLPLKSESPAAGSNDRWLVFGVCLFLAAIIWVVFGQTLGHQFVNYDDGAYVYENPEVIQGLTLPGIVWAFTHVHSANWHPLTWISHMLDCQFYGLKPGGHHLTNVLLHTATAILLFLVLRRMTGFLWRSAFVAAVFAIHPLRVESVAWVAERKDVLSGLFFMLTVWAYVRYVQRESKVESRASRAEAASGQAPGSGLWTLDYFLVVLMFGLGLMCKPMLVTVPLVLLLLDYWPLGRVTGDKWQVTRFGVRVHQLSTLNHLLYEKLPLLGLAAASCAVTIFAQHKSVLVSLEGLSFPMRAGNAMISSVAYLGQMFWPSGLAVLYPFPVGGVGVSEVMLSLVVLAGISAGVFVLRRRAYLMTGWWWYLIMLAPVIGIVQVGAQARADRYTYLPQIGIYLLLTWAVAELCAGWRHRRVVLGGGAGVILVALIICAREQTAWWRNSETLWTHTLACTTDNFIAENVLGNALFQKGDVDEAITQYQKALRIKPDYAEALNNLGNALFQRGEVDAAIAWYQKAVQIKPDYAEAHNNLGNALLQKGEVDEAIAECQKALQIRPDGAETHNNLGNALFQKGEVDAAIAQYQEALQIKPDGAEAHNNLGSALLQKGNVDEAIVQYREAVQIKPDYANACNNLGTALFQKGDMDEAITQYQRALEITPDNAVVRNNLDNALRQKNNIDGLITRYRKALEIKPDSADVLNNLAWLLATCPDAHIRDGVQAVKDAQRACELTDYNNTICIGTLAAAYAEAGRFDEAVATAQKAMALAEKNHEPELLQKNRELLELYRAHKVYRE